MKSTHICPFMMAPLGKELGWEPAYCRKDCALAVDSHGVGWHCAKAIESVGFMNRSLIPLVKAVD